MQTFARLDEKGVVREMLSLPSELGIHNVMHESIVHSWRDVTSTDCKPGMVLKGHEFVEFEPPALDDDQELDRVAIEAIVKKHGSLVRAIKFLLDQKQ